jgi:processive 1,2-diacylglycerol beta-glucosyltransferase
MGRQGVKRLLVLSVGYGQGHHSAAQAMAEHYAAAGWQTRMEDVCESASPRVFRLTQAFYRFCVRRAPWLWGVTYSLTDTADWTELIRSPWLRPVQNCLRGLIGEWEPDFIICTYPLFAYMLDALQQKIPYAVVVTDAQEISRPWMLSRTSLVTVPDSESARMVRERYALDEHTVVPAGFPVRRAFCRSERRMPPDVGALRVLYGAYRRPGGVIADIAALLSSFPDMVLTVIAGQHLRRLQRMFAEECRSGRLILLRKTTQMPELLAESHFYVGKAGAATMFECYAALVPAIVNFTLPGQEQGNLQLLLQDGAGCHAESTQHLVQILQRLLAHSAEGWHELCEAMERADRTRGAERIAAAIERRFGV